MTQAAASHAAWAERRFAAQMRGMAVEAMRDPDVQKAFRNWRRRRAYAQRKEMAGGAQ